MKTHCKRGHERTLDNLRPTGNCIICEKQKHRSKEDPLKKAERMKKYWKDYPEKRKKETPEQRKAKDLRTTSRLPKHFIAHRLRVSVNDLPDGIVEVARLHIILKRELKPCKSSQ